MKRRDSLIGQVIGVNLVLITATLFAASLVAGLDLTIHEQGRQLLVLVMAIVLTLLVNVLMLRRRFAPLERLIDDVEAIDPAQPSGFETSAEPAAEEIERLAASFRRILARVEDEQRRSGRLVLRAQEEERRRVALDLHDEVNQSLTAILLRLEALHQDASPKLAEELAEVKTLVNRAMEELLGLARKLRPLALEDGLVPAIDAQVRRFASATGIDAALYSRGEPSKLGDEQQLAVYRIAQEALSNAGHHSGASRVDVELASDNGSFALSVRDDGRGFDLDEPRDGLGLEGMVERARLAGGALSIESTPGMGTALTLRIP